MDTARTMRRKMAVGDPRIASYCRAVALFVMLGAAFCGFSSEAQAGDVHFGIGIGVPFPAYMAAPPVVVAPPPAVVVDRAPPVVVYEERPVVVERRSRVYYYPAERYHRYREETRREYRRDASERWEEYDEY